jgi:hypothetical protein
MVKKQIMGKEKEQSGNWDKVYRLTVGFVLSLLLVLLVLYVGFSICFTWELMNVALNPEKWLIDGNKELSFQIRITQGITAGILGTVSFTLGRIYLRILGLARRGKIESYVGRIKDMK